MVAGRKPGQLSRVRPEASAPPQATPPLPAPGSTTQAQQRGVLSAAVCYFMWGLVPIFWKQLADINAVELIAHRHLWSLVFVVVLLAA